MAALAQPRRTRFQQRCDIRPMCNMAIAAVIGCGRMLPQKRSAFFGVTDMAGFIDGIFHEQFRPGRAMNIVAISTGNSAGRDRMGGQVMHLCALVFVARKTDFTLRFHCEHFVLRLMNCMTRHAGHVVTLMRASLPMDAFSGCVAIEAGTTLRVDGRLGRAAENKIRWRAGRCTGLLTLVPHMRAAGTVAGLTSRLPGNTVARAMNRQDGLLLVDTMTACANGVAAVAFF